MEFFAKRARLYFICYMGIILTNCSPAPDKLGNLDLKKWRADRAACKNERKALAAAFKSEESKLLGKFSDEIGKLLGRPDINQLGDRNTKYYVYFLEKGPQCEDMTKKSEARKVVLKFNAVGLLSEITYQDRAL
ncbi:hypothetical protein DYBT9275_04736 [Dyadobacter sp. CECT 9275]|uniref:Uncharacterized protein n=1 Tax=Dyadobacter helix TaxID=2822344 RepID=A0A916JFZ6_9BACT|nr:hypothetical protein [Dyadobacter sp. CECT 9275]CAG5010503.1 hypothetical protein DYBT9275_04736 [Dyadobacter sp. CECT 9275]